jgi:TusA-related sulfurtransferase
MYYLLDRRNTFGLRFSIALRVWGASKMDITTVATVDSRGKTCPEPQLMMKNQLDAMQNNEVMEVLGDTINKRSMERFVKMRRHDLLISTEEGAAFRMFVRKSPNARTDIPIGSCILKPPVSPAL